MANILIVDDDAAFRDSLAETLADLGHRAVEAASGRAAQRAARRRRCRMHLSGFLPAGSGRAGRARATARRSRAGRDSGRHADGPCDQRQHDRSDAARRIRSPDEADRASRHRATARPHRVGESAARTRAARQRFRGRAVGGPTAAAGRERRDARRAEAGRPRRDERRDRAPDRRDGHGQGGGRPRAAASARHAGRSSP